MRLLRPVTKPAPKPAPSPAPNPAETPTAGDTEVRAPMAGTLVPLPAVADPVFSAGLLGPGVGIVPDGRQVLAPVSGTVVTAFPTGHAYGLRTTEGVEVLVHVGIDTVELDGRGFTRAVSQGAAIRVGEPLGSVDLAHVRAAGYDPTTIVVVLNSSAFGPVTTAAPGPVAAGETVLTVRQHPATADPIHSTLE